MTSYETENYNEEQPGDFESALDVSLDTVKMPENVPTGTWTLRGFVFTIKPVKDKEGKRQDLITLGYDPYSAGPDVDPTDVEKGDYKGKRLWVNKYIDSGNIAGFKEFLAQHGISLEGRTARQALEASFKGSLVRAVVGLGTRKRKDGTTFLDNVLSDFTSIAA